MIKIEDFIAPLVTDFYKTGHVDMTPAGTTRIYSNITPRSSRLLKALPDFDEKALIIGLQRAIDDLHTLWVEGFFKLAKNYVLNRIRRRLVRSLPSNVNIDGLIEHFADLHDLGHLPIRIKTLPEGRRVRMKVPFLTIVNTHDCFAFITNYLETIMSNETWKTIVNATTAFEYRRYLSAKAIETTGNDAGVLFQGHDFSARGMSGFVDSSNSGIAHLSCFVGTDTISAIEVVEHHYDVADDELVGCSVPATEHMIMCLGGQDGEINTFRRLIQDSFPTGIISIVSDTWDFFQVVTSYVTELKDTILSRGVDSNGMAKVVFRPDSGDPVKIICGDPDAPVGSPEHKGAVECLWDVFGGTVSEQGYKIIHERVGLIYGDSITLERMVAIVEGLMAKGFASVNVIFGIGSYTYQFVTRDSLSIATKATEGVVDGVSLDLLKNPKTDGGTKKSASGLLRVEEVDGEFVLFEHQTVEQEKLGALVVRYENGQFFNRQKWSFIRGNVEDELLKMK